MSEENLRQLGGQVANTQETLRHRRVHWMGAEIQLFFFLSFLHCDSVNDVLLRSVLDSDETKPKGDVLALDHSLSVCTFVHDIDFGNDTDGSNTFRVQLSCHL